MDRWIDIRFPFRFPENNRRLWCSNIDVLARLFALASWSSRARMSSTAPERYAHAMNRALTVAVYRQRERRDSLIPDAGEFQATA